MKRIIQSLLPALLLTVAVACQVVQDEVAALRSEVEDVRLRIQSLNDDLGGLRAIIEEIQRGGYALQTEVLPEEGDAPQKLAITFNDGRKVVVTSGHIGTDGVTDGCLVGVTEEDGVWYWTLNGEGIVLPSGDRMIAVGKDGYVGITPQLSVEDGNWMLTLDGGATWKILAPLKGEDGFFVIAAADITDRSIVLTLADGSEVTVSRRLPSRLTLAVPEEESSISAGETLPVPYTLSDGPEDVLLVAGSDGRYGVRLEETAPGEGILHVTCPETYADGYVYLLADDKEGYTAVRVIQFHERYIDWLEGTSFQVDAAGGTLTIPYVSSFGGSFVMSSETAFWLHPASVELTPDLPGALILKVDPNGSGADRTGTVEVRPANHPAFVYATLTVVQKSK